VKDSTSDNKCSMQMRWFARNRSTSRRSSLYTRRGDDEADILVDDEEERVPAVTPREILFGRANNDPEWYVKEQQALRKSREGPNLVWFEDLPISGKIRYILETLKETTRMYLWTWKDFTKPQHKMTEEDLIYRTREEEEALLAQHKAGRVPGGGKDKHVQGEIEEGHDNELTKFKSVSDVIDNLEQNMRVVKEEGPKLSKELTGISNREEFKEWLGEQMKLAIECLSSFMKGYRGGRDEEVEKMLNEYFQELEEKIEETESDLDDDCEEGSKKKQRRRKIRSLKYNY
jgi:hypothetical protein